MIKKWIKKFEIFFVILLILIFWSYLFSIYSPNELVETIGVTNGYIILFLIAALGGVSSFTISSLYATIVTLTLGGLNPFLIGILGGIGITIGDSLFYYLGYRGRKIVSPRLNHYLENISTWLHDHSPIRVQFFIYLWAGFSPFPNDIMTISLGLNHYNYKKVLPPLVLGNITFTILFALAILYIPDLINL